MSNWIAKLHQKKVFLWDFDGCIADTERLHFLAYQKAFAPLGHTINETEYYYTFSHLGGGAKKEIENYKINANPETVTSAKPEFYWDLIKDGRAQVFPEVENILKHLKSFGRVAIVSNSPKKELDEILRFTQLGQLLDLVLGSSPGLRKKPFPDLYLKALEILGANSDETIVFEDSDRGLAAAQAAGCDAIWIKNKENESFDSQNHYLARVTHAELLAALQRAP